MIAILGSGISLAGLMIGLVAWLRADMRRVEDSLRTDMRSMEERLQENINNVQQEVMDIGEDITALREAIVARAAWNASNTARGSITQDA